jgi:Flp pilus assembly protein TadD
MRHSVRALFAIACLVALAGCSSSSGKMADLSGSPNGSWGWGEDTPPPANPDVTGSTKSAPASLTVADELQGSDRNDDLSLGKRHYRERNYGLAEQHFRRAAEKLPRDGEAWLGLAASYDRLKRYDLADRAYREALGIYGPRPEVLNNIGYSFLLRGDLRRARAKFAEAQNKDPDNPTIANNIALVDEAAKRKKGLN